MVISNENIVRVYRIFLKITAIGMEGVRKGVVCFTYKSSPRDGQVNQRFPVEMCTIKKRGNLLQVHYLHFSPALRQAST
jgi:hypothetical protein